MSDIKTYQFFADGVDFGIETMTLEEAKKRANELQLTFEEIK